MLFERRKLFNYLLGTSGWHSRSTEENIENISIFSMEHIKNRVFVMMESYFNTRHTWIRTLHMDYHTRMPKFIQFSVLNVLIWHFFNVVNEFQFYHFAYFTQFVKFLAKKPRERKPDFKQNRILSDKKPPF